MVILTMDMLHFPDLHSGLAPVVGLSYGVAPMKSDWLPVPALLMAFTR